ncbi:MAG: cytochrome c-type biogenesis protein CcmH [Gemmatimonadetes bacterium]|nr:cytochrome c-type biogenesis protein CcmH [Gemmatimonadota bacterium]
MRRATLFLIIPLIVLLAAASTAISQVDSVVAEARERLAALVEEQLIAPCCWRAPLSQHYSGTAERMKDDLRVMLADGKTQAEIIDHYKAIYGERILSAPPNAGFNRLAYLFTPLMFLVGGGIIFITLRRWRAGRMNRGDSEVAASSGTGTDPRHRDRIDAELNAYD